MDISSASSETKSSKEHVIVFNDYFADLTKAIRVLIVTSTVATIVFLNKLVNPVQNTNIPSDWQQTAFAVQVIFARYFSGQNAFDSYGLSSENLMIARKLHSNNID